MMENCSEALVSAGLAERSVKPEPEPSPDPSLLLHGDTGGHQSRRVLLV